MSRNLCVVPALLSVKEAADLLGVEERTVRKNVYEGKYQGVEYQEGVVGRNGVNIKIPLLSLPEKAQIAYTNSQKLQKGKEEVIDMTAKERQEMAERISILDALDEYLDKHEGKKTELIAEFVAHWNIFHPKNKISKATLYRWAKLKKADPTLLAKQYRRKNTGHKIAQKIWKTFLHYYLDQSKLKISVCYELVKMKAREEHWEERIPSLRTFERAVKTDLTEAVKTYWREGPSKFHDKHQAYLERDYTGIAPNQIWISDHHQIDMAIKGPNGKPQFPWLTCWQDARTRRYLGWFLSFNPNSNTIMAAFHQAAKRYGLPDEILIDNGKDYRCKQFAGGRKSIKIEADEIYVKSLTALLGVVPRFSIPYHPQSKPIERSFLTLKEYFSRLSVSYRGGHVRERPERLINIMKKDELLLSLEELEVVFADWAENIYNELPHSGQGMNNRSPREVFDELCKTKRTAPKELLDLSMMRTTRPLKVQRNGVWFFGRWYKSEELFSLQGQEVYARYDREDISRLYIFDKQDLKICEAVNRELANWDCTASHEDIRAIMKERKRNKEIVKAYKEIINETMAEPDDLKRIVARAKAEKNLTEPLKPKVIQPINPFVKKNIVKSEVKNAEKTIDLMTITKKLQEEKNVQKEYNHEEAWAAFAKGLEIQKRGE